MGRRNRTSSDSLDLLLDTICNTFGGVLFISLLVTIMLNMSSDSAPLEPPSADAQAALETAQDQLEKAKHDVQVVQAALEEQQRLVRRFADPTIRSTASQLTTSQQALARQLSQHQQNLTDAAKNQAKVNEVAREVRSLEEARRAAQEQLRLAQEALAEEVSRRERTISLPKLRETQKVEIACFLKAGRLHVSVKNQGGQLANDSSDTETRTDAEGQYITPKAGAGTSVNLNANNEAIEQRLASFNPNLHYVAIFVWKDSYEHFQWLRNVLVRRGFEYRLEAVPDDVRISIGGVNNIRVQ